MTDTLIEAVARAIGRKDKELWGNSACSDTEYNEFARAALAAIEASGTHQVVEISPMKEAFAELAATYRSMGLESEAARIEAAGGLTP